QQYSYTTGKNSTDSALIIDAMDMLYSNNVDGFCIVSSDSDFTRLAMRLRESGMMVIGMGEEKTPNPFVKSCHQFKFLDIISDDDSLSKEKKESDNASFVKAIPHSSASSTEDKSMTSIQIITNEILNIISDLQDNDNGINIGEIGQRIIKRYPDFDVRNYGYSKLSRFLNDIDCLEIKNSIVLLKNDISDKKEIGLQISKNIKNDIIEIIQSNNNKALMSLVHQKVLDKYPNYIKKYGYNKAINFYKSLNFISIKKCNNSFFLATK
ncbi:MAG: NYN domain-containing protein, partial [Clostridium sp.]|nr:NYN domain-containing protein [Clostridium sp.]